MDSTGILITYGIGFVVGWLACWVSDVIKIPAVVEAWLEKNEAGNSRDKDE